MQKEQLGEELGNRHRVLRRKRMPERDLNNWSSRTSGINSPALRRRKMLRKSHCCVRKEQPEVLLRYIVEWIKKQAELDFYIRIQEQKAKLDLCFRIGKAGRII